MGGGAHRLRKYSKQIFNNFFGVLPFCYGIYGNGWKIANYLIGDHYPGSARDVRTSNGMLSSVKRLLVTMVLYSNFFSRVIFLMSPQIVCLKWCKVAKIAFPRFFFRVISNVYTNALLLETILNQNGFICVFYKFNLQMLHRLAGLKKYIALQLHPKMLPFSK